MTDARNDAQIEFDQILAKARKAYRLSEPAQMEQTLPMKSAWTSTSCSHDWPT